MYLLVTPNLPFSYCIYIFVGSLLFQLCYVPFLALLVYSYDKVLCVFCMYHHDRFLMYHLVGMQIHSLKYKCV